MNFEIFTDSSANLTDELIDKHNINVVSLVFIVNGKEYISYTKGGDNNLQKFYTMLRQKSTLSTSCVNEQTFYDTFEDTLKKGKDILYIGFSSALSGTYNSAHNALENLKLKYPKQKIMDIDTLGASLGQGLLVLYAAIYRSNGQSIEQVHKWLEDNKLKLCHYFTVDDLFFLFRGGRVKSSSYLVANLINIKPIMHMDDFGRLVATGKVIGRTKSLNTIANMVVRDIINPENQILCITHGDCIDDVEYLKKRILDKIKVKEIIINYVDPVVGAHSGPGTIAIFFLGSKR